jgi:hypothetical protein
VDVGEHCGIHESIIAMNAGRLPYSWPSLMSGPKSRQLTPPLSRYAVISAGICRAAPTNTREIGVR